VAGPGSKVGGRGGGKMRDKINILHDKQILSVMLNIFQILEKTRRKFIN